MKWKPPAYAANTTQASVNRIWKRIADRMGGGERGWNKDPKDLWE
jgi:NAD-dependent oxidoreductase involved in siderophore biosynthesis